MAKETKLDKLVKRGGKFEELQSILQETEAMYEKSKVLSKDISSLSEQLIKTEFDHQLSILTYGADNYIKMIDVCIDILKFLIPTFLTLWTVTRVIPQFSETSVFIFSMFSFCLILLFIAIIIRMLKVKNYVSKFKNEHKKFVIASLELQKNKAKFQTIESDHIKKTHDLLKERYGLVGGAK